MFQHSPAGTKSTLMTFGDCLMKGTLIDMMVEDIPSARTWYFLAEASLPALT